MRRLLLLAGWAVSGFASAPTAAAAVVFVATTGNDNFPCTQEQPCLTIARGQAAAAAGDIVEVAAGSYDAAVTLTKSGVTYRGYTNACPVTTNSDSHAPHTRSHPTVITRGWTVRASDIIIDCFEIRPSGATPTDRVKGVVVDRPAAYANITVINSYFHDNGVDGACYAAFYSQMETDPLNLPSNVHVANNYITRCNFGVILAARDSTVTSNEIRGLRSADGDMDYMRLFGVNLVIRANYMHGNSIADCVGINCHIDCFQSFNVASRAGQVLRHVVIDRNTCFNAHQGVILQDNVSGGVPTGSHNSIIITNNVFAHGPSGLPMSWCMLFNSVTNISTFNNTFVDCGQTGYRDRSTAVHRNNIHVSTSSGPIDLSTVGLVAYSDNLFYSTTFAYEYPNNLNNRDPLFVDSIHNDFHLKIGSPAVDAGATLAVPIDRLGIPRPQGARFDIGAFEQVFPLRAPKNLRIVRGDN